MPRVRSTWVPGSDGLGVGRRRARADRRQGRHLVRPCRARTVHRTRWVRGYELAPRTGRGRADRGVVGQAPRGGPDHRQGRALVRPCRARTVHRTSSARGYELAPACGQAPGRARRPGRLLLGTPVGPAPRYRGSDVLRGVPTRSRARDPLPVVVRAALPADVEALVAVQHAAGRTVDADALGRAIANPDRCVLLAEPRAAAGSTPADRAARGCPVLGWALTHHRTEPA